MDVGRGTGTADESTAPEDDGAERPRLAALAAGLRFRLPDRRPSAFIAAGGCLVVAVAFLAMVSYYGAEKFSARAAQARAAAEAQSFAGHSSYIATGDAFNGYLQILRYADDPVLRSRESDRSGREAAMAQLLFLNTNRLQSLTIVDRAGYILATTDASIRDLRESEAFNVTRRTLSPTNSDIILPEDETRGYVEFTAALRAPDGAAWAILYGRADPDTLWQQTLRATVDGSRNVVINAEGKFAAGVPGHLLRQPWRGAPLQNGSVRATIDGVDSVCGLGPIGRDSQIDHGWNVASCLPMSLIAAESNNALGEQFLLTAAGALVAIVIAGAMLRYAFPGGDAPPAVESDADADLTDAEDSDALLPPPIEAEAPNTQHHTPVAGHEEESAVASQTPAPDVDALQLIEANERRNARVSARLRESVQARLMIAAAQAEEALRVSERDPERAAELHRNAMAELAAVRDGELRVIGQELHPSLIRLGLPAALRSLAKGLAGTLDLRLDIDPSVDSAGGGGGRVAIGRARRLIIYRAVHETARAVGACGGTICSLSIRREDDALLLSVRAEIDADRQFDTTALDADRLAFEAYGGTLAVSTQGNDVAIEAELPAPGVEIPDEPTAPDIASWEEADAADGSMLDGPLAVLGPSGSEDDDDDVTLPPRIITFAAPLGEDDGSLADALDRLASDLAGHIAVTLDLAPALRDPRAFDPAVAGELRTLAGASVRALAAAGAPACRITMYDEGGAHHLRLDAADLTSALDSAPVLAATSPLDARGASVTVAQQDDSVTISVRLPATAVADAEEIVKVVQIRGAGADDGVPASDEPAA